MSKYQALFSTVVVEVPPKETMTDGGVIVELMEVEFVEATVLSVGKGRTTEDVQELAPGDKVLISPQVGVVLEKLEDGSKIKAIDTKNIAIKVANE